MNKNAITNMKCSDEESFKWTVTRVLNPTTKNSERVTKILRRQFKKYNWEGVNFPTSLENIETFEKNNDFLINVFGFDEEKDCVTSLRLSKGAHAGRVLLMFVDNRYTVVKSVSRLLCKQTTKGKRKGKRFYCNNCLQAFTSEEKPSKHVTSLCETSDVKRLFIDLCDLCSKRGESLCPLHMSLKGLGCG